MILLASFLFILNVSPPTDPPEEKLFCRVCGQQNLLTSAFCFHCGTQLDKTAMIARLGARIAASDSGAPPLILTSEELTALIDARADQKLRQLQLKGNRAKYIPPTETERVLNIVAPSLVGVLALLLTAHLIF